MDPIQDLMSQATALLGEAKTILLDPKSTSEDVEKAERLYKDVESIKARASKLKDIEMAEKAFRGALSDPFGGSSTPNPEAAKKFANWGDYCKALAKWQLSKGQVVDPRLKFFEDEEPDTLARKDMSSQTLAGGGALIDVEQYNQLMAVQAPKSIIRPRATIIRMGKRQIEMPVLDQSQSLVAGVPAFFGGIQAYWQEEATSGTVSDAKFRKNTLTAHQLIGYTQVSNQLLADADMALADFLGGPMGFPGVISWMEDYAFLVGSGAGQPLGVLNSPAAVSVTRNTGSTIKYDDFAAMESAFYGQDGIWIATLGAKAKMLLAAGPVATNYAGSYLWGSMESSVPLQVLGRPLFFTDKLPAVGTKGDLMLVDPKYYLIGDRQATTVDTSDQQNFKTNQTAFRVVHRVDGQPWLNAPITMQDNATYSPFVVLN